MNNMSPQHIEKLIDEIKSSRFVKDQTLLTQNGAVGFAEFFDVDQSGRFIGHYPGPSRKPIIDNNGDYIHSVDQILERLILRHHQRDILLKNSDYNAGVTPQQVENMSDAEYQAWRNNRRTKQPAPPNPSKQQRAAGKFTPEEVDAMSMDEYVKHRKAGNI